MPKTAMFFPAILVLLIGLRKIGWITLLGFGVRGHNGQIVDDLAFAGDSSRFILNSFLFFFGSHLALQGHGSVLSNHLDVMGRTGKRFIRLNGFADLLGGLAVRLVFFLLIGRGFVGIGFRVGFLRRHERCAGS